MIERRSIILNQTHNMRGESFKFRKFYKPRHLFINVGRQRTEKIFNMSSFEISENTKKLQKYLKSSVSLYFTIGSVIIQYYPKENENMTKKLISEIINIFDMVIE